MSVTRPISQSFSYFIRHVRTKTRYSKFFQDQRFPCGWCSYKRRAMWLGWEKSKEERACAQSACCWIHCRPHDSIVKFDPGKSSCGYHVWGYMCYEPSKWLSVYACMYMTLVYARIHRSRYWVSEGHGRNLHQLSYLKFQNFTHSVCGMLSNRWSQADIPWPL